MANFSLQIMNPELRKFLTYRLKLIFIGLFLLGFYSKISSQEYFQQEVNYNIQVILNDQLHELNAFESLEYIKTLDRDGLCEIKGSVTALEKVRNLLDILS